MVETYSSYLLVFLVVDHNDLLVAVGITLAVGQKSGDVVTSIGGSGSGILWVTGVCSTCWCWVVSAAFTGW